MPAQEKHYMACHQIYTVEGDYLNQRMEEIAGK